MNVLLYGLVPTRLNSPSLKIRSCKSLEELKELTVVLSPDLLLVEESMADETVSLIFAEDAFCPIIVICTEDTVQKTRYWSAQGATSVWTLLDWEDKLSEHQSPHHVNTLEKEETSILSNRSVISDIDEETIVIAVGGICEGAGSTHTALLISNFLARTFKTKVALWEGGNRPCFRYLEYIQRGEVNKKSRFEINDVTYFSGIPSELAEAATDSFRFFVMDLGSLNTDAHFKLFNKAKIPILCASGAEWRMVELLQFCQKHSTTRQDRWKIVLPLANENSREETADCLKDRLVFSIPPHSDVYKQQQDSDQMLEGILSSVIHGRKVKKKFGFF
ncbi:hypothetical protein GC101_26990 [Paenibacillus sp. LMG 31459]|uniref:Uncharacterized protein n=1 Tax=Paenibacillus phytohabitans TaxID=2654978 RepID=A0ABX1YRJ9_9BACL|nr:hypothetical protein [Paenibacillus phytohabitans]NOU82516.1 hypothetical protein [Paenibacillus phytohabitans]